MIRCTGTILIKILSISAEYLRYHQLAQFDAEINHLDSVYEFTCASQQVVSEANEEKKLLVCERGALLFIFNFHPADDYTDLKVCQLPITGWFFGCVTHMLLMIVCMLCMAVSVSS